MSQKKLTIAWPNGNFVELHLLENPLADYFYRCINRLKNIDLQFGPRENPLDQSHSKNNLAKKLVDNFKTLGYQIDFQKLKMQNYLNELHDLYFKNFSKDPHHKRWLEIHDLIHLLENSDEDRNCIWVDYRELAGPLTKKFDRQFLKYATTSTKKGHCYFSAHELGKDPYKYWQDGEIDDLENICQLAKPWLSLRPLLDISIGDSNSNKHNNPDFLSWFEKYRAHWCRHWGLTDWQPWELAARIPVGYVSNIDFVIDRFTHNDYPNRITDS